MGMKEEILNLKNVEDTLVVWDPFHHWSGESSAGPEIVILSPNEVWLRDGMTLRLGTLPQIILALKRIIMERYDGYMYMTAERDEDHVQNISGFLEMGGAASAYLEDVTVSAYSDQMLAWGRRFLVAENYADMAAGNLPDDEEEETVAPDEITADGVARASMVGIEFL